ncbi:MAG TPA: O-antigen ligase family protein [Solirubrobacteraceae bacterium]|nr:O-antigen ligase family protein [Solirubrobacteraceae bacterium]
MATRPLGLDTLRAAIPAAALAAALLVGILLAQHVTLGIGLLIAACYLPLVLVDPTLGLALWVVLVFVEHLPAVSIGPNAAGILVALAWLGTLRAWQPVARDVLRRHRGLLAGLALLVVWVTLSLTWASAPAAAVRELWPFYVAGLLVVVVATMVSTPRRVRLLAAAFVAGAVLSVLVGLVTAAGSEGRLEGGAGDPNFLAAALVPAVVLAVALCASVRSAHGRLALAAAIVILAAGFAATASRGGMVAAVVTGLAAIALYRGRRLQVALLVVGGLCLAGASLAASPAAWERVTSIDTRGNGRADLWHVAWRMSSEHPVAGVGLDSFRSRAAEYVRRPGSLRFVDLIAERPRVVHNTYLQLLAETGIVGLALFLLVVGACLRAGWRACTRFDGAGEPELAALARAAVLAAVSVLAAGLFLSDAVDKRLWLLLGLGPALLGIAMRCAPADARPR